MMDGMQAQDSLVYGAIACDARRRMLELLRDGEHSVGRLVGHMAMSQPAVSQHLGVLERAGLVERRAEGRYRFYRLRPEGLRHVASWTERFRALWEARLDALGDVLDEMDDPPDPPDHE